MTPVFLAFVEKGRLKFQDPAMLSQWLETLVGKQVEVLIRKKERKRTSGKYYEESNANGWYWGVIIPLSAKELGYTPKEMHEVFTELYAPYSVRKFTGTYVKIKCRTSEMNTLQFSEYCETIRQKMAELGVIIPDPDKIHA